MSSASGLVSADRLRPDVALGLVDAGSERHGDHRAHPRNGHQPATYLVLAHHRAQVPGAARARRRGSVTCSGMARPAAGSRMRASNLLFSPKPRRMPRILLSPSRSLASSSLRAVSVQNSD
jgi:hypothetical protein